MRKSNFELLRIISMLFIVTSHYSIHGGWELNNSFNERTLFVDALSFGGKLGVNIFVMITGYFLVKKETGISSIKKVLVNSWFYSILFLVICVSFNLKIGFRDFITSLTPFGYWFINAYVILIIISPMINKIVSTMKLRDYFMAILLGSFLVMNPYTNKEIGDVGVFIYLYIIGSGFMLFDFCNYLKRNTIIVTSITLISMMISSIIIIDYINNIYDKNIYQYYFIGMTNPLTIITAVSLFWLFSKINIKHSKLINKVSSLTLGVYLIHENNLLRGFVWSFINKENINNNSIYLYSLTYILTVFVICCFIEILKIKTFTICKWFKNKVATFQ